MRWLMTLLVVVGALGLAAGAGAEQRYSDAAGDSGSGPDITQVTVTNDSAQLVVRIAAAARFPTREEFFLLGIDTDRNAATGDQGLEVRVGITTPAFVELWNGSAWIDAPPAGISVRFELSSSEGSWRVQLPRSILNTTAFDFWLGAALFSGDEMVAGDRAPNGGSWRYEVVDTQCANGRDDDGDGKVDSADRGCSGTEDDLESDDPYTLTIARPIVTPAAAKAGRPIMVKVGVRQVETNQAVATGAARCTTKVGSATRRSTGRLASGIATCRLVAPKVARPTTIRGTITVTSRSVSISAPFSFRATT